jgi:hypothetical protein
VGGPLLLLDVALAWHRNAALIAPLVLVNSAAVYGQAGWAYDHLFHYWALAVLFATALESIGVYLAAEAHAALMAGDASARLRLSSYAVGTLIGSLNYAHFASPGYRPNPLALTFGLLSSISPWLWSIRSRSLNRDRLRELGQVDPRAVRFSVLRWALFPLRTWRAFRAAVWAGTVQPAEAVAAEDRRQAIRYVSRLRRPALAPAEPVPAPSVEPVPARWMWVAPAPLAIEAAPGGAASPQDPEPDGVEEPEPVPAPSNGKRRPPVPDRRILRRLTDPEAVPRRSDNTVPVRLVEDLFGARQDRAVRLLQEAGLYRSGEAEGVPAAEAEPVPTT